MSIPFEEYWLCNYISNAKQNDLDWPENLKSLWNCDWNLHLGNKFVAQILLNGFNNIDLSQENINTILVIGIASLQAFVQDNFVGPPLSEDETFSNLPYHSIQSSDESVRNYLNIDGEELNSNVTNYELLALAKLIFTHLRETEVTSQSYVYKCWYLRYCYVHQLVIDEHAESLFTGIVNVSDELLCDIVRLTLSVESKAIVCLEIVAALLHYRRISKVDEILTKTRDILGATLTVEGRLGVRTKYQEKPLPQLLLKVDINETIKPSEDTHSTDDKSQLPILLQLDDDIRLERIKFVDETDNVILNLSSVAQALVLGTMQYIQKSQPKDKLADEELQPYILTLLQQNHGPWSIRITTLLTNILLESTHKRTVERSLRQCEQLLKIVTRKDETTCYDRLSYVYASHLRPQWFIRATLGDLMVSLGLIKSALDLYLQIEKWDSVISCYTVLELKHKAAEIIRMQLEKKPTVELYCLLGDATDDITWYEKAWEFSNEKSGRAQRHLGCYYFAQKQYEKAIPHLEKSLTINSLQENAWARLGYAALTLERWELAAHAYRQYTNIEPNGFECWNNLAKAYINLGDKKRAHKIFTEALRCNFDNWKVWENYLLVSVDTGNFEDALNAHQRLTDIKEKYLDKEVIAIVVRAIRENLPDADGRPSSRLAQKASKILAQLCVQYPKESILFEFAAQLSTHDPLSKAQKLQKAYRSSTQGQPSWFKYTDSVSKVLELARDLCEASLEAYKVQDESKRTLVLSQLSSARLSTQGCLRAIKDESNDSLQSIIEHLQKLLAEITNILTANM